MFSWFCGSLWNTVLPASLNPTANLQRVEPVWKPGVALIGKQQNGQAVCCYTATGRNLA